MNGIEPKLNENFIFETLKNSAVILIIVEAFWAVMYQIPAVNGRLFPALQLRNKAFMKLSINEQVAEPEIMSNFN